MTASKGSTEDRKYLADAYRAAAFDLLRAARRLRDITAELRQTKVKVARPAVDDLAEAVSILDELPAVRAATTLEKV